MQNIKILHEEKDFIIINKPAGIITHSDGKENSIHKNSIAEEILKKYPEIAHVGEISDKSNIQRAGIVHRLDVETSGVMIIARNQDFFNYIKTQFKEHKVKKEYKAFVWGHFKDENKKGFINMPIGKSKTDFRRFVAGRHGRGELREAMTYYEVINQCIISENKFSYISVKPKTGRTHQIRVHMKYIHHGIVSDSLYMENSPKALGFERHALHAHIISFMDREGTQRVFVADFPDDFERVLKLFCK